MQVGHDPMVGGGVGEAQGAEHGESLAAAMADHADPINAQQEGAAMFGMVEAFFNPAQVVDQEG
jgi:hypothetical protein